MKKSFFKKTLALLVVSVLLIGSLSAFMFVSAAKENETVWNDCTDASKIECVSGTALYNLIYGGYLVGISEGAQNATIAICNDATDLSQYDKVRFSLNTIGASLPGITSISVSVDQTTWCNFSNLPPDNSWDGASYELSVSDLGANIDEVIKFYIRFNGTSNSNTNCLVLPISLVSLEHDETDYEEYVYDWKIEEAIGNDCVNSASVGSDNMVSILTTASGTANVDIAFSGEMVDLSKYDTVSIDFFSEGAEFSEFSYYLIGINGFAYSMDTDAPRSQNWNIIRVNIPTSTLGNSFTDNFIIRMTGNNNWPRNIKIGNIKLHKNIQVVSDTTLSIFNVNYSGETFNLPVSLGTNEINVELPYGVTAATITPKLFNSKASFTVDGEAVSVIDVTVDDETVAKSIVVTAEDGITTKTYTLNVIPEDTSYFVKTLNPAIDASTATSGQATITAENGKFNITTNEYAGNVKIAIDIGEIDLSLAKSISLNVYSESSALSDWDQINIYTNNSTTDFCTEVNKLWFPYGWHTEFINVPIKSLDIEDGVTNTLYFELKGNSQWNVNFDISEIKFYSDYMEKAIMDTFTVTYDDAEIDLGYNPYIKNQKFCLPSFVDNVTLAGTALFNNSSIQTALGATALDFGDNVKEITLLAADGKTTTNYTINIRRRGEIGDINCDGIVAGAEDFVLLKNVILGSANWDAVECNINEDENNEVNILDLVRLKKIACEIKEN